MQTGLFTLNLLENNQERTATAAMAGMFAAIMVGTMMYLKKKDILNQA